jgi:hypothetical protein
MIPRLHLVQWPRNCTSPEFIAPLSLCVTLTQKLASLTNYDKKKLVSLLQSKQNHQLHLYMSNRMSKTCSKDNFDRKSMRNLKFSLRRRFMLLVFWVLIQYWLLKFRRNLLPPSWVSFSTLVMTHNITQCYNPTCLPICGFTLLFVGPWLLFQFLNPIHR